MKIVKLAADYYSKNSLGIAPDFLTANFDRSGLLGFYPCEESTEKALFFFQRFFFGGKAVPDNTWEIYNPAQFIFHDENYSKNKGIYFSINKDESEAFRRMALFEYYWALNDYTILVFAKEFKINEQVLNNIANDKFNQEFLLAEMQINEDAELLECVHTQSGGVAINNAYDKAILEVK